MSFLSACRFEQVQSPSRILPVLCCLLSILVQSPLHAQAPLPHPLEPLSADELRQAVRLLRAEPLTADHLLVSLSLKEPPKVEVLSSSPERQSRREARALLLDPRTAQLAERVINLRSPEPRAMQPLTEAQPPLFPEEQAQAAALLQHDPRWRQALAARGLTEPEQLHLLSWLVPASRGVRRVKVLPFVPGVTLPTASPVEGLSALVELTSQKVVAIQDEGPVPVPAEPPLPSPRPPLQPFFAVQPRGPSFTLDGHALTWDRWRLRYSFQPREGLVLHRVEWRDGTTWRPVLYRASLAELLTLTGEPEGEAWTGRCVLEGAERGLGTYSLPLERGLDLPDNAVLRDEPFVDAQGEVSLRPARVGIYERDAGVLWRQHDPHTGRAQGRRGLELVLSSLHALSAGELLVSWSFRQDGSVGLELTRLGAPPLRIQLPGGASEPHANPLVSLSRGGGRPQTALPLTPLFQAPNSQQFVSVRLDLDIDGVQNSVLETNLKSLPMSRHNPEGTAFVRDELPLLTEVQAQRDLNMPTQRRWRVVKSGGRGTEGVSGGYVLLNQENAFPLANEKSLPRKRALFPIHHLWVTRYREGELAAAGELSAWSGTDGGLSSWAGDNESLDQQDIVIWYTLGLTSLARPEDFPFYGPQTVRLRLEPSGFLDQNGALDLPRAD